MWQIESCRFCTGFCALSDGWSQPCGKHVDEMCEVFQLPRAKKIASIIRYGRRCCCDEQSTQNARHPGLVGSRRGCGGDPWPFQRRPRTSVLVCVEETACRYCCDRRRGDLASWRRGMDRREGVAAGVRSVLLGQLSVRAIQVRRSRVARSMFTRRLLHLRAGRLHHVANSLVA